MFDLCSTFISPKSTWGSGGAPAANAFLTHLHTTLKTSRQHIFFSRLCATQMTAGKMFSFLHKNNFHLLKTFWGGRPWPYGHGATLLSMLLTGRLSVTQLCEVLSVLLYCVGVDKPSRFKYSNCTVVVCYFVLRQGYLRTWSCYFGL